MGGIEARKRREALRAAKHAAATPENKSGVKKVVASKGKKDFVKKDFVKKAYVPKEKAKKPKHLNRKLEEAKKSGDKAAVETLEMIAEKTGEEKLKRLEGFKTMVVQRMMKGEEDEVKKKKYADIVDRVMATGQGCKLDKVMEIVMNEYNKETQSAATKKPQRVKKTEEEKAAEAVEKADIEMADSSDVDSSDSDSDSDSERVAKQMEEDSDSDSGADGDEAAKVAALVQAAKAAAPADEGDSSSSAPSDSESDDSDSDSESEAEEAPAARSRGSGKKRTRDPESFPPAAPPPVVTPVLGEKKEPKGFNIPDPAKKTKRSEDTRKCIGRKPITDLQVGERMKGSVKYIKEGLGAFIDVNCHSDALVHVSMVSDTFVKSVSEVLKEGDEVDVRVMSVDKKKKKVTLSMQSDAVIDKALKDKKGYEEREMARKAGKPKGKKDEGKKADAAIIKGTTLIIPRTQAAPVAAPVAPEVPAADAVVDTSKMTKDELKRHEKILRRAAARAEREAAEAAGAQ